jgi:hypothetical protein
MNATIFASGFYLYNNKCFYVDEYHTMWGIQPTHSPEGTPVIITKLKIFDISRGHPPFEHEVKREMERLG